MNITKTKRAFMQKHTKQLPLPQTYLVVMKSFFLRVKIKLLN